MKVYVDTSAFIAFRDRSDTHHLLFARLFSNPPSLITSPFVIAEGHAWFLKRYDGTRGLQFLDFIKILKTLSIPSMGIREIEKAIRVLKKYSDQELTLVDAMGLCIMEDHNIRTCWSTDRHLGLTGIPLVIHQTE